MREYNGIYEKTLRDYGKVTLNISDQMIAQNITRNKIAELTGTKYNVINRYYKGENARVDLDVLARICFVLDCEIQDVLKYEKA